MRVVHLNTKNKRTVLVLKFRLTLDLCVYNTKKETIILQIQIKKKENGYNLKIGHLKYISELSALYRNRSKC